MFCNPHHTTKRGCTPIIRECRKDMPLNCSRWVPGVTIQTHSGRYHQELLEHTFCLAFPGDGWSSRVLDAVVHGCIPVIVQDDSAMFFEGIFDLVGAGMDYSDFSLRVPESELPRLLEHLDAVSPARLAKLQTAVIRARDYFVYKDVWSRYRYMRAEIMSRGRAGQDAFLMLALGLEARARRLGALLPRKEMQHRRLQLQLTHTQWLARNRALLGDLA